MADLVGNYVARCEDCRYYLRGRGEIGTAAFGIKHAIAKKHLVIIAGPRGYVEYNKRVIIEAESDEPPF